MVADPPPAGRGPPEGDLPFVGRRRRVDAPLHQTAALPGRSHRGRPPIMCRSFDQTEREAAGRDEGAPLFGSAESGRTNSDKSISHRVHAIHLEIQVNARRTVNELKVEVRIALAAGQERTELRMLRPGITEGQIECGTPEGCSAVELLLRKVETDVHPLLHANSVTGWRRGARSTRYIAPTMARPPMIMRTEIFSPPRAIANAAAQTGSMAMITAALNDSTRACAQVCSTMVRAPATTARYTTINQSREVPGSWIPGREREVGTAAATVQTAVMISSCTTLKLTAAPGSLSLPSATMCPA